MGGYMIVPYSGTTRASVIEGGLMWGIYRSAAGSFRQFHSNCSTEYTILHYLVSVETPQSGHPTPVAACGYISNVPWRMYDAPEHDPYWFGTVNYTSTTMYNGHTFYYLQGSQYRGDFPTCELTVPPGGVYSTLADALVDIDAYFFGITYQITYHLTNCTAPTAPTSAMTGDTVNVQLQFPSGYSVVNSSDAYVMNNGVIVPSTYSNGTLTFTMP